MKTIFLVLIFLAGAKLSIGQSNSNPNYQPPASTSDAQNSLAQPQNMNPNPQREVIVPRTEPNIPPPQVAIPPATQNNASYYDNAQFYNKDNSPSTETNNVPASNGSYSQPGYSNPNNKPSTQ